MTMCLFLFNMHSCYFPKLDTCITHNATRLLTVHSTSITQEISLCCKIGRISNEVISDQTTDVDTIHKKPNNASMMLLDTVDPHRNIKQGKVQ